MARPTLSAKVSRGTTSSIVGNVNWSSMSQIPHPCTPSMERHCLSYAQHRQHKIVRGYTVQERTPIATVARRQIPVTSADDNHVQPTTRIARHMQTRRRLRHLTRGSMAQQQHPGLRERFLCGRAVKFRRRVAAHHTPLVAGIETACAVPEDDHLTTGAILPICADNLAPAGRR